MASSNAGGKFYICETPKPNNLTQAEYEALTWLEVTGVGSLPDSGSQENIISYDTIDQDVTDKSKGMTNAGDGTLELSYSATDPGQVALRAAAATKYKYATKRELEDAPSDGYTNSIFYNRGLIAGPVTSGGRNEDFVKHTFTLGYVQKEILVVPEEI